MMARMVMSPIIVRRQCHDTDGSADPIVRNAAAEERAVSAIVLDREEADEQAPAAAPQAASQASSRGQGRPRSEPR